jgi:hypothetical protein
LATKPATARIQRQNAASFNRKNSMDETPPTSWVVWVGKFGRRQTVFQKRISPFGMRRRVSLVG